jgi:hypothetical protein
VVVDDSGFINRSVRLSVGLLSLPVLAELAGAEELGGAANAGALHNSSDASAAARRWGFMGGFRLMGEGIGARRHRGPPEYARAGRRGHTPQVMLRAFPL